MLNRISNLKNLISKKYLILALILLCVIYFPAGIIFFSLAAVNSDTPFYLISFSLIFWVLAFLIPILAAIILIILIKTSSHTLKKVFTGLLVVLILMSTVPVRLKALGSVAFLPIFEQIYVIVGLGFTLVSEINPESED